MVENWIWWMKIYLYLYYEWDVPYEFEKIAKHTCPNSKKYLSKLQKMYYSKLQYHLMKGDKSLHWMECSAWPVFFMPIRRPPLVSSHMSPAFWPPLLTANKLATTSSKSLLKWNILHLPFQVHIEGVSYNCDICGKTSGSKNGLQQHKAKYHRYLKLFEPPPPLSL